MISGGLIHLQLKIMGFRHESKTRGDWVISSRTCWQWEMIYAFISPGRLSYQFVPRHSFVIITSYIARMPRVFSLNFIH